MPLFSWGKRKQEVEEIKEAVAGQPMPYAPLYGTSDQPMAPTMEMPSMPQRPMPPSMPTAPQFGVPQKVAPLFVKIEKYKEILETVAKLKGTLANIESIFKAQSAIDKLEDDATALLQRQFATFDQCVAALDSTLVRPPALDQMIVAQPEIIENDMQQLSSRLNQLSEKLREID
jgi:hypothetical protein